jgi:hypothetical protein
MTAQVHPTTHIHCISTSLQVLRELNEVSRDEWDDFTLMRALAHLHAINASSNALKDWCAAKAFVQKLEQA